MLAWLPSLISLILGILAQVNAPDWVAANPHVAMALGTLNSIITALLPSPVGKPTSPPAANFRPGLFLVALLAFPIGVTSCQVAYALEAVWDRNSEADMSHYNVYICKTRLCTVPDDNNGTLWVGKVDQPPIGQPFWKLPDEFTGGLAVNAEDKAGNGSRVTATLNFSSDGPPSVPSGLRLR